MYFSKNLTLLRTIHNLSRKELREKLNIKTTNLIDIWENDIRAPHPNNVKEIAELFDIPVDYLIVFDLSQFVDIDSRYEKIVRNILLSMKNAKPKRITQAALSKGSGVGITTLNKFFKLKLKSPSSSTLNKILNFLELELSDVDSSLVDFRASVMRYSLVTHDKKFQEFLDDFMQLSDTRRENVLAFAEDQLVLQFNEANTHHDISEKWQYDDTEEFSEELTTNINTHHTSHKELEDTSVQAIPNIRFLKKSDGFTKGIPDAALSAGDGNMAFDDVDYDMVIFPKDEWYEEPHINPIRVKGRSMEGKYYDGDIVWVDESYASVDIHSFGAFAIDGDLYIKKMGDGELISINPYHDDIPLNEYTELITLGRVVDRMSKEEFDEIKSIVWE